MSYIYNLSANERVAWISAIVIINILFGFFIRWSTNSVYKKTNLVEEAVDRIRILIMYPFTIILIGSVFTLVFIFIPVYYKFGSYDLLFTILTVFTFMILIVLFVQAIFNDTMKSIRKTEESQKEGLKKAFLVSIISVAPIVLIIAAGTIIINMDFDSILLQLALIIGMVILLFFIIGKLIPKSYSKLFKVIPIEDKALEEQLLELTKVARIENITIQQWLTKNNKIANAIVTGGKNKVIYISDYLIENATIEEILAIFAHELGHIKKRHIIKRRGYSVIGIGLMVVIGVSYGYFSSLYYSSNNILFLLVAIITVLVLYNGMFMKYIYRKQEKQADQYVIDIGIKAEVFSSALTKLNKLNNMKASMNKIDENFQTHPTVVKRIEYLSKYENTKK